MTILVTEYTLPDGRRETGEWEVPPEVQAKADLLTAAGFHFECEILTNGMGSFTIGDDNGDYAFKIISNPRPHHMEELILKVDLEKLKRQAKEAAQ